MLAFLNPCKARSVSTLNFKGFGLVVLGLYPWVLESLKGILGDYVGSYKGYVGENVLGVRP